jgi:hypothetical protein
MQIGSEARGQATRRATPNSLTGRGGKSKLQVARELPSRDECRRRPFLRRLPLG